MLSAPAVVAPCVTVLLGLLALPAVSPGTAGAAGPPVGGTLDLVGADATLAAGPGPTVVAFAGDLDGDGVSDVAVGSPLASARGRTRAGAVRVLRGTRPPPAAADLTAADGAQLVVEGAAGGARAGTALAALGDVDGDGLGDLLVGAPRTPVAGRGPTAGAAYVVRGAKDGGTVDLRRGGPRVIAIPGGARTDRAGTSVAAVGDLDGDGRRELLIGAPGVSAAGRPGSGAAFVVLSSRLAAGPDLARPEATGFAIFGPAPGAEAGTSVAGSADVNGDGLPELLVGAPGANLAALVFGSRAGTAVDVADLGAGGRTMAAAAGERAGQAVADAGDVDGDGTSDAVIGAPEATAAGRVDAGSAYVVFGDGAPGAVPLPPADAAAGFRIDGADAGDRLGAAVAAAGDADRDGLADVLAGAPRGDPLSRPAAGEAYLVFGGPLDLALAGRQAIRFAGRTAGAATGRSLAGGVDADGDGRPDVLIGADGGPASLELTPRPLGALPASRSVTRTCTAPVTNFEVLVGDSTTMRARDPENLRRQALELLLAKPRPQSTVLGAIEFGSGAAQILPPLVLAGEGYFDQLDTLRGLAGERLRGDAGGRNLAAAFAAAAAQNPGREAQILIVDGPGDGPLDPGPDAVAVPTFVVALGVAEDSPAGARLRALAEGSGGAFYADVRPGLLQPVLEAIDQRLACQTSVRVSSPDATTPAPSAAPPPAVAAAVPPPVTLAAGEATTFTTGPLVPPSASVPVLRSVSLVVSWRDRRARYAIDRLRITRPGREPLSVPPALVRRAAATRRVVTYRGLRLRARRGRGFIAITVTGLRASPATTTSATAAGAVGAAAPSPAVAATRDGPRIRLGVRRGHRGRGGGLRTQASGRWGPR